MLEKLRKSLAGETANAELATQLSELQTQFTNVQSNLENAVITITELTSEKENLLAQLAELTEANKELAEKAKSIEDKALEEKLASRKAKLESVVGSDKAAATFEAIKGLEDVTFDAVIAAMSASFEKESTSELFKETGLSGEPAPANEMSLEEKILRAKYQK